MLKKTWLSFLLILILTACNTPEFNQKQPDSEATRQYEVSIFVTVPEQLDDDYAVEKQTVLVETGDSVIDATEKSSINYRARGSKSMAYVYDINGLQEFDEGPASGWMVKVNNELIPVGAGSYQVAENDLIEWFYTIKAD